MIILLALNLAISLVLPQSQIDCGVVLETAFHPLDELVDGYCDRDNWVPGLLAYESNNLEIPPHVVGRVLRYNPGIMEMSMQAHGIDPSLHSCGVALMTSAYIGHTVWLKPPGGDWEKCIVADASNQRHTITNVHHLLEVAEIDFDTAVRWGMATSAQVIDDSGQIKTQVTTLSAILDGVELYLGEQPPDSSSQPIDFVKWWTTHAKTTKGHTIDEAYRLNPDPR